MSRHRPLLRADFLACYHVFFEDVAQARGPLYAADLCFALPPGSRVLGALEPSLRYDVLEAATVDLLRDISWQIGGRGDRPEHLVSPPTRAGGIDARSVDELKEILARPREVVSDG